MNFSVDIQSVLSEEEAIVVDFSADTQSRKKGAITGMYIGDALAMPVHWYYDRQALERDYGRVTGYLAPKNPHPDSILGRSAYTPVNEKADILHDQARFWGHSGIHYHQFLQAGELLMDILLPVLHGEALFDVIAQKVRRQDSPLIGYPLMRWLDDSDEIVVGQRLSTACYVEDAMPATVYLALKYHDDAARGLVANTNLGGDSAGRGAVLGALLGAANGYGAFPEPWIKGLRHPPPDLTGS